MVQGGRRREEKQKEEEKHVPFSCIVCFISAKTEREA
jgi:hypothetical protein